MQPLPGMSIVTRISFFTYAVVIGLGQGFQPLCGFCYGASLLRACEGGFLLSASSAARYSWRFAPFSASCSSEPIIELFRDDASVVAVDTVALKLAGYQLPSGSHHRTDQYADADHPQARTCQYRGSRPTSGLVLDSAHLHPASLSSDLLGVEMCQAWADVCSFALWRYSDSLEVPSGI